MMNDENMGNIDDARQNLEEVAENLRKKNEKSDLMEMIITPDLASKYNIALLTKELKVSNIKRNDLENITEMSDLSLQWERLGAKKMAMFLLIMRDVRLSATSSVDGFERTAANTEINAQVIVDERKESKIRKLFKRRGGNS